MSRLIDLTHFMENDMPVFPGDDKFILKQDKFFTKDKYNNFILKSSMHVGTHLDSPMHMTDSSKTIDQYPLDYFCGKAIIINVLGEDIINYKEEYEKMIESDDIVFIHTGFDKYFKTKEYFLKYPVITTEFADLLIRKKVKLVGFDTPSPDYSPFSIHKVLLSNNIFIIENLCNLNLLLNESFEVFCFPLKVKADASLLRVVAKCY